MIIIMFPIIIINSFMFYYKKILFMITTDIEIIRDNIASSIDLFRDAYVYDSLNTAVAVGFSESFAGGISAVLSLVEA